jgi:hypothetical protein
LNLFLRIKNRFKLTLGIRKKGLSGIALDHSLKDIERGKINLKGERLKVHII